MNIPIFSDTGGNTERDLWVNEDGSLTYREEYSGWSGRRGDDEPVTLDEAKRRWPQYAGAISDALDKLASEKASKPKKGTL